MTRWFSSQAITYFSRCTVAVLIVGLTACGKPVPEAKLAYVGLWQSSNMSLHIYREGRVEYSRHDGGVRTKVNAPIQGFQGDNIEVGVGPMRTSFIVTKPPYLDGDAWKMVVDGVTLTRVSDQ